MKSGFDSLALSDASYENDDTTKRENQIGTASDADVFTIIGSN
jgi:hypothetical protein